MKTHDEHAEQVALFRWAAIARSRYPELALLYAIPNGGHRHIQVARRLKAEGVKPGVPDICLPVPRGNWSGLYIELKTARGTVSKAQRGWLEGIAGPGLSGNGMPWLGTGTDVNRGVSRHGHRRGTVPAAQTRFPQWSQS